MSGVIVLTSSVCVCVCVCVCVGYHSNSQTDRQTYGLEFRHVGQKEGYLGQVCRSGSYVKKRFNGYFNGMSLGELTQ